MAALASVTDTARRTAYYRALESERPDAIFHDPYARQLAGKRAEDVVRGVPRARASAWGIVTRTTVRESAWPAGSNPSAWICEITRNGARSSPG